MRIRKIYIKVALDNGYMCTAPYIIGDSPGVYLCRAYNNRILRHVYYFKWGSRKIG